MFITVYTMWQALAVYGKELGQKADIDRHSSVPYPWILRNFGLYSLAESPPYFSWSWVRFPTSVFQSQNYYPSDL